MEKTEGSKVPHYDVFLTDEGEFRVDEMDRDGLLQVIDYLKAENDRLRGISEHRFNLLRNHWGLRR